ncbi:hypothetical protein, partial [uncultured Salinicola sp.]|uniref:hypothetical protein n=1 Tax=uncultured Salinicola sp. TaxID=1193542 RepID=UPI00262032CA
MAMLLMTVPPIGFTNVLAAFKGLPVGMVGVKSGHLTTEQYEAPGAIGCHRHWSLSSHCRCSSSIQFFRLRGLPSPVRVRKVRIRCRRD